MPAADFAALFIALYVGGLIGDHIVQTDWQAANKGRPDPLQLPENPVPQGADADQWRYVYAKWQRDCADARRAHRAAVLRSYNALARHVAGYVATQAACLAACALVLDLHLTAAGVAAALTVSGVTHGIIDRRWPVQWLCRHTGSEAFGKLADHGLNGAYLVDQTLHNACLLGAALLTAAL